MANKEINIEKGHWFLASLGKKVLRPGGRELSRQLLKNLAIKESDNVVEFAPGIGATASLILEKKPASYTGVELNEAVSSSLREKFPQKNIKILNRSAAASGIASDTVDKLIGEAMLTMQPDHRKSEIIAEAYRILRKGGLYAIHELSLVPDSLTEEVKKEIQLNLAEALGVNARPLTQTEWATILENEGFKIKEAFSSPMHLLEPNRIIEDEGILGAAKIGARLMANPQAKKKLSQMRKTIKKYESNLSAVGIIVEK